MLISQLFSVAHRNLATLVRPAASAETRLGPPVAAMLAMLLTPIAGASQQTEMDRCLLDLLSQPDNDSLTVLEIKQICRTELLGNELVSPPSLSASIGALQLDNDTGPDQARFSAFFEPYKDTYFVAGAMKGHDGYEPFSGKTTDIKFALGLKFRLFPDLPAFENLAPLYFGYSQKSWWDIAESSGPFKEHNYNPEIFWDYSKTSNRNGFNFVGQFIDQVGYEHQSNGRDGSDSRSWDRFYIQRDFLVSDRFSLGIKAWKDVNVEAFNSDITDFLGNLRLNASYQPNERLTVNFNARQGQETSKVSYQLDLIYRLPEWVNSQFMLSYYEGYGEALISYNQKTSSLRAGLFFPISFDEI